MKLAVALAGASDVGSVRDQNEDRLLVGDLDRGELVDLAAGAWHAEADRGPFVVVCDGMGGVAGGEIASELAAGAIWREIKATAATPDPEVFARLMRRATRIANLDVYTTARREPALDGMGTTVSAAAIVGDRLLIATVGDSRAYVLRRGVLVQVTRDQSLTSALLEAGKSPDEALGAGSAILQALGAGPDVEPSLSIIELRRGDRVLLCSDGLHGLVSDPALALLLGEAAGVAEAVGFVVDAARAAGGLDNITACVLDVGGERLAPPRDDADLPTFREFDPQKEGDPALTEDSYVARRLAARIGLPTSTLPPTIPATGQHMILRSKIGLRVPTTALPIAADEPAEAAPAPRLGIPWWAYALAVGLGSAIAWWFVTR